MGLEYEFQWFPFSKGPVFSGSSPFFYGGVCKKIPTWDSRKLLKLKSYETPGFDQIRWTATSKCKRPATCVFFFWKEGNQKKGVLFKKGGIIFLQSHMRYSHHGWICGEIPREIWFTILLRGTGSPPQDFDRWTCLSAGGVEINGQQL